MRGFLCAPEIVGLLLAIRAVCMPPQEAPCSPRIVLVNVTDSAGNPVEGLDASNFRARFGRYPVPVLSATSDAHPRRIVLLLDASGSMFAPDSSGWKSAISASKDLLNRLPPQHSVGLIVFASKIEERMDFTQTRQSMLQRLDVLQVGEKAFPKGRRMTALWDAVLASAAMFEAPQPGDAIYAITDGRDNESRADPEKTKGALLAEGVRFFAFVPPPLFPRGRTPEELEGPETLREVAQITGGELVKSVRPENLFVRLMEPAELRAALDESYRQMTEFYQLKIQLPQPVDKMQGFKLKLVNPRHIDKNEKHFELFYPRKLLPCTQ